MTNPCLLCGPGGGHDPGCIYDDERRMKMGIYDYVGGQYHPDSKTSTEGEPNCPSCASFAAQLEEAREAELRDDIEKYWRKRVGVLEQEQSDFIGCINVYKKAMQSILSECESQNSAMESLDAILNIVNETFRKANNTFYGPHRPAILDRLETLERMEQALRKIASLKPKEKPEWGDETASGNYDDVEASGWDICAWAVAEIAEQALEGGAPDD